MNLSNYKAVILAGGKGTRFYPITKEIPKVLLPINRKPIINYLVDLFIKYGIKEIAVLISRDFEQDFVWWKKRYYAKNNIRLVIEEGRLGTFGGLFLLKEWLSGSSFFLTNGDELKDIDLKKMIDFHNRTKTLVTIAIVAVENPQDYGVVICNNSKVKQFLEKPDNPISNYINSGFYLLNPEIFNYHPGPEFLSIEKDIFPRLAKENKLSAFKFKGSWADCGTWERYKKAILKWKTC